MCGDSADEASTRRHPETDEACTSRHPEDERDQKLKELTATVAKLASVIEHMSKSQKSEPVELKPRSRSPRRRHRSSRDSRTPRRGRRRSRSRRDSGRRSPLPRKKSPAKKRSPSPKESPVSRSPVKIVPQNSSGHRSLPSRPSAPSKPSRPTGAAPCQDIRPGRSTKYEHSDWENWSDRESKRVDKSWIEPSWTKQRARPRTPESTSKSTPPVPPVRKTAMSHDPLEDILQEPIVKEIKECMDQAGSSQSGLWSNKHYSQVAVRVYDSNPTELTSAHLDELVALARRHKNRDRTLWIADDESPSLCDGEDHQGVRVNIRIKGGCHTTYVPFNSRTMSGWLKTTFVRERNSDTEPPGPWYLAEHMFKIDRRKNLDNSWSDMITFAYPGSNAGGEKVLRSDAKESVGRLCA